MPSQKILQNASGIGCLKAFYINYLSFFLFSPKIISTLRNFSRDFPDTLKILSQVSFFVISLWKHFDINSRNPPWMPACRTATVPTGPSSGCRCPPNWSNMLRVAQFDPPSLGLHPAKMWFDWLITHYFSPQKLEISKRKSFYKNSDFFKS